MTNSTSIVDGVDAIFDRWLAVPSKGKLPYYSHRSADLVLSGQPYITHDPLTLIAESLWLIDRNWMASQVAYGKPASRQNWRFERQVKVTESKDRREGQLERALAAVLDDNWANQVPTASGLTGPDTDKHRQIDLAHRSAPGAYTFYELKVVSQTNKPLYAAMEVLVRGLLYIFTRQHLAALGYDLSTKELLHAHTIHLRVLAPSAFYVGVDLTWLATSVTTGLTQYLATAPNLALTMDFAFDAFPFAITHTDTPERLREALAALVPMYV